MTTNKYNKYNTNITGYCLPMISNNRSHNFLYFDILKFSKSYFYNLSQRSVVLYNKTCLLFPCFFKNFKSFIIWIFSISEYSTSISGWALTMSGLIRYVTKQSRGLYSGKLEFVFWKYFGLKIENSISVTSVV